MTTMRFLWLLLTIMNASCSNILNTNEEPTILKTQTGRDAVFMCRSKKPLTYCRFIIPNLQPIRITDDVRTEDYVRFGDGLAKGECGIHLFKVTLYNEGKVLCEMGIGNQDEVQVATFQLVVGIEPESPRFEAFYHQTMYEGEMFADRCVVSGGKPAANISFYLSNERIVEGLSEVEVYDQSHTVTVAQRIEFQVKRQHDTKTLVCRAEHFAYPNGFKEGRIQLRVLSYSPNSQESRDPHISIGQSENDGKETLMGTGTVGFLLGMTCLLLIGIWLTLLYGFLFLTKWQEQKETVKPKQRDTEISNVFGPSGEGYVTFESPIQNYVDSRRAKIENHRLTLQKPTPEYAVPKRIFGKMKNETDGPDKQTESNV